MAYSASFDLRGKRIQDTYQNLIQSNVTGHPYSGVGDEVGLSASFATEAFHALSASWAPDQTLSVISSSWASRSFSSSHAKYADSCSYAATASVFVYNDVTQSITFFSSASWASQSLSSSLSSLSLFSIDNYDVIYFGGNVDYILNSTNNTIAYGIPDISTDHDVAFILPDVPRNKQRINIVNYNPSNFPYKLIVSSSLVAGLFEDADGSSGYDKLGLDIFGAVVEIIYDNNIGYWKILNKYNSTVSSSISSSFASASFSSSYALSASSTVSSSWSNSSSYSLMASSASWSSVSFSSSYALSASSTVSSSWSFSSSFARSSSHAYRAFGADSAIAAATAEDANFAVSASMSANSISSSYAVNSSFAISASWASQSLSASWSPTLLITASTYPITASWAINVVNGVSGVSITQSSFDIMVKEMVYEDTISLNGLEKATFGVGSYISNLGGRLNDGIAPGLFFRFVIFRNTNILGGNEAATAITSSIATYQWRVPINYNNGLTHSFQYFAMGAVDPSTLLPREGEIPGDNNKVYWGIDLYALTSSTDVASNFFSAPKLINSNILTKSFSGAAGTSGSMETITSSFNDPNGYITSDSLLFLNIYRLNPDSMSIYNPGVPVGNRTDYTGSVAMISSRYTWNTF